MKVASPADLVRELTAIFPEFAEIWDKGHSFGYTSDDCTFHAVFQEFSALDLARSPAQQIQKLCALINDFVAQGGDYENAVSTCFLEHAARIGARNILKPCLSAAAKRELR